MAMSRVLKTNLCTFNAQNRCSQQLVPSQVLKLGSKHCSTLLEILKTVSHGRSVMADKGSDIQGLIVNYGLLLNKTPRVQKARPIRSSNYLTTHATKSFDIS